MFAERLIFRFSSSSSSLLYFHFQSTGDVRERLVEFVLSRLWLHTAAPLANVSLSLSLSFTRMSLLLYSCRSLKHRTIYDIIIIVSFHRSPLH
jgi:hypothetical protein